MAGKLMHKLSNFSIVQIGGRATAPMHLGYGSIFSHQVCLTGDFPFQMVQIHTTYAGLAGHDLIAGTVVANVLAKGQVNVERQWCSFVIPFLSLPLAVVAQRKI